MARTLYATAGTNFQIGSTRYAADENGVVASVADDDVVAMLNAGCSYTAADAAEQQVLDETDPGAVANSKAAIYSATGVLARSSAAVAALGSNQGNAAALTAEFNVISAADATKGVVLPTAAADVPCVVINNSTAVLKVYPATGAAINAGGANVAFAVGPGRTAVFIGRSATQWYVDPVAAVTTTVADLNKLTGAGAVVASGTQAAHIADVTGGTVVDVESRATIATILNALEAFNIAAAS